jgi:hypothetical protein
VAHLSILSGDWALNAIVYISQQGSQGFSLHIGKRRHPALSLTKQSDDLIRRVSLSHIN